MDPSYEWANVPRDQFDETPYGKEFATQVADMLEKKLELLIATHRDYCGNGLAYEKTK